MSGERTVQTLRSEIEAVFSLLDRWCMEKPVELAMVPEDVGWSVQLILEHIGIANHYLMLTLRKGVATAVRRAAAGRPVADGESDLTIFTEIADPDAFDWQPPGHMVPSGKPTITRIRDMLRQQHEESVALLDQMSNGEGVLHTVRMSVRNLGRLDMYQWLWFMLMHARRHLAQMDRSVRRRSEHPHLRLVRGRNDGVRIGTARLFVVSAAEAPDAGAVVLEEDTWLVLSAEPKVTMPPDHPIRIFTDLHKAQPLAPGAVIERQGRPMTLMAVVYDFEAEPCCRSEWVAAALSGILRICRERGLRSILLPLLGVRHGRMRPEAVLSLLVRAIRNELSELPVTLRLLVSPEAEDDIRQMLMTTLRSESGTE